MSGKGTRDYAGDLHAQHDRELADRVGVTHIDPKSGVNSKIPLRVTSVPVSSHERKETLVPNKTGRK